MVDLFLDILKIFFIKEHYVAMGVAMENIVLFSGIS